MIGISSGNSKLLNNTLTLVHLARETAIAHGRTGQAERLSPIVDDLKRAVEIDKAPAKPPSPVSGTMTQQDFRKLLSVIQSSQQKETPFGATSPSDRNRIVIAMAAGGMQEVDIARQMGISRDEVRTLLQIENRRNRIIGGQR